MSHAKQSKYWAVVADGSKCRVYSIASEKNHLELVTELNCPGSRTRSHELGSEKPHGIMERNTREMRVDLHLQEKERFAHRVADMLNKGAAKAEFQQIILSAPPKFLGSVRPLLNKQASQLVKLEINKDLTNVRENDLSKHIFEHMD